MEAYLKNFNSLDARFHTISVRATNNQIAKKIQPSIINSISRNDYFNLQKEISDINIKLQDSLYKKQIIEIDSLQLLYKRVMLKEAERAMEGTNISLGENGKDSNKELALINKIDELKFSLVELNEERANKSSILNVISDFPRKGVELKGFLNSYKFLVPCILLGLTFFVLILISLNAYLKNYKKES
jgi:DNA polymerase III delta prime subunit